ncbi:uncharacterized protein LOC109847521 [Asparagus officinalis]|uniref:uncharacterized protein LOC109847521 n=1 Tax=Asparagus officinalis TaxID=4686 RepID=UPI00098E5A72|nr:uncharacterized protein LOC109847521 [Asparagus officinalis]
MRQELNEVPPEILNNPRYYPYFKDCIGMIDSTHIDTMLLASLVSRFSGRKRVTQNVPAACTSNKLFTYVLAWWKSSANDYKILQDTLSRPQPHWLRVYDVVDPNDDILNDVVNIEEDDGDITNED